VIAFESVEQFRIQFGGNAQRKNTLLVNFIEHPKSTLNRQSPSQILKGDVMVGRIKVNTLQSVPTSCVLDLAKI
jgi:hypothetical protein